MPHSPGFWRRAAGRPGARLAVLEPEAHDVAPLLVQRHPRAALGAVRAVRLDVGALRVVFEELDAIGLALAFSRDSCC